MSTLTIIPVKYDSQDHIDAILRFEHDCNEWDSIPYQAGIEFLAQEDGDRGVLCFCAAKPVGLLSWHADDGLTANVNARVHPHYRRQGVFRRMLQHALEDIAAVGFRSVSYRIPRESEAGIAAAISLGAVCDRSEYGMALRAGAPDAGSSPSRVELRPARPEDFEFMAVCLAEAFGDSENWTREYLIRTNEPSRTSYIAWAGGERVGTIRSNAVAEGTAVLHDFCIMPALQGKKLGSQALQETVRLLRENSCSTIRLSVVADNERALRLYLGSGFEVTRENLFYIGDLQLSRQSVTGPDSHASVSYVEPSAACTNGDHSPTE